MINLMLYRATNWDVIKPVDIENLTADWFAQIAKNIFFNYVFSWINVSHLILIDVFCERKLKKNCGWYLILHNR